MHPGLQILQCFKLLARCEGKLRGFDTSALSTGFALLATGYIASQAAATCSTACIAMQLHARCSNNILGLPLFQPLAPT